MKVDSGGSRDARLAPELSAPIRLTWLFFATSVVIVAVVLAGQAWLFAGWLHADILENSKTHALRVARNVHHHVTREVAGPGAPLARADEPAGAPPAVTVEADFDAEAFDFAAARREADLLPEELRRVDEVVQRAIAGHDVVHLYIFDGRRRIVYSTRHEDIGYEIGDNEYYDAALAGEVTTVLVERGSPVDVSKQRFGVLLQETYVPIWEPGSARPVGVIEVYQDAAAVEQVAVQGVIQLAVVTLVGFAALVAGMWVLVARAQRILDARTGALIHTNEALVELSEELEAKVEARGRQLSRAETLASVGTLAAGVAHEVNNPIATVASCAEGLLRTHGDSGDERLKQYLELIRDESFRIKSITRNLLDFSRPASLQREPVDIGALVEATAKVVSFRLREAELTLDLDLAPGCEALGDAAALRQVLLNLTINAIDASQPGGRLRWTVTREAEEVVARCEDEGCGISEEDLARVHEPFFTTKAPGRGTGLGLSLSQGIMDQHGGRLEVESAAGEGTRVTLRWPAARSEA